MRLGGIEAEEARDRARLRTGSAATSAGYRSVHVIAGSIAANGTPSTAARQTAPPPSEMPDRADVLSRRRRPRGRASRTGLARPASSRGPSSETSPPDCPWPRASKVEHGVALSTRGTLRDPVHVRARPAEAVEHHDRGPAARGRRPVGHVQRRRRARRRRPSQRRVRRSSAARRQRRRCAGACGSDNNEERAGARPRRRRSRTAAAPTIGLDGSAASRRVRLGRGRPDRPARVPRHDAARGLRLPRRPRAPARTGRGRSPRCAASRARSARYLEGQGVKLIVVACNTATSAALPQLQESSTVPVVGVITPEAHAAVQATRNRRVGLLATRGDGDARAATQSSCTRSTPASSFFPVACPRLVPLIESDDPSPARRPSRPCASTRAPLQGGGRRHRHPRLHALPADPPDPPARLRPRRDARLLRRGDGARGRRDARAQGDRERRGARGRRTASSPPATRRCSARSASASCSSRSARSST